MEQHESQVAMQTLESIKNLLSVYEKTIENVAEILDIPNRCGLVVNSQFQAPKQEFNQVVANNTTTAEKTNTYNFKYIYSDKIKELQQILNSKGFTLVEDGLFGINTLNALRKYTIEINDSGSLTKWTQEFLASKGYNVGIIERIVTGKQIGRAHV